jgi:membrane protease YdiL (CAAX protease family)
MLSQSGSNNLLLILIAFLELLLLAIPITFIYFLKKEPLSYQLKSMGFDHSRYNLKRVLICIFEGILIGSLFLLIANWLIYSSEIIVSYIFGDAFIQDAINNAINVEPTRPNPLELTIIVLLQFLIVGPCEEGFFRGFLFKKLRNKLNFILSLLLSSAIFAFYHVPPFIVPLSTITFYFGYFFALGILLTLLYSLNKGLLLPCIITHSIFNMIVLIT